MNLNIIKIIIVTILILIHVPDNNSIASNGNNTFVEFKKICLDNDKYEDIKPSKYFEITNNEIVFYKWQENPKYKDQFNYVFEPVYENSKQVRLNPEKDSFINDIGEHPGRSCPSFSTNATEPFQILILDKKKRLNRMYDNNSYILIQLYIIDNDNFEKNYVNFFTTMKSKILSSDIMLLTESYKMKCWKQNKDKLVFDFEKAMNPDVLDSEDQKSLETLFLYRYCREPWYHEVNVTNKALGFINNVIGNSTVVVKGKSKQLKQKSLLLNNKLMYPLSSLARDLDFSYSFDDDMLKIKRTKENTNEVFSYDIDTKNWTVQKDNKTLPLLPKPYKIGNETMIPLRTICELIDARVFWRDIDRSVLIERF